MGGHEHGLSGGMNGTFFDKHLVSLPIQGTSEEAGDGGEETEVFSSGEKVGDGGEETDVLSGGEEAGDEGEKSSASDDRGGEEEDGSEYMEEEAGEDEEEEGGEEESENAASKDGSEDTEVPPNFHRSRAGEKKRPALSLFKNFPTTFGSWLDFHEVFQAYQVKTSRGLLKRQGKKQRKKEQFLSEEWGQYSKTLVCTHGQPYHSRGKGRRKHEKVRGTECSDRVNARVKATLVNSWVLRVKVSGSHNHDLNEHVWDEYSGNRTMKDAGLQQDVEVLRKAGATAKGILQYLRERTGKKTKLKDVHNMIQRQRVKTQAGLNDAQRALAVLDEFCRQNGGNSAEIVVDFDTDVARIVTFQTAKMKRLFKAFPEVVLVDSTHDTNANRYKLFSFVVHDVFGKVCYCCKE
ncbi:hypothetical protein PF008_g27793 [Phytophthora fragariae]|uniref:ZSWIM1/3 RNaseH-like domain-containing protein n=1 Tax=Phytophthora fragariae TaxID=53985 RepID=A0A6G0QDB0_9STRA|nr:hypothetical protein PF008_g27793 [Phytophthora fragariae]